jgi:hypothetical protein
LFKTVIEKLSGTHAVVVDLGVVVWGVDGFETTGMGETDLQKRSNAASPPFS